MRALLFVVMLTACGSAGAALPDAFVATLTSITVTPGTVTAKRGLSAPTQLRATVALSDSRTIDVSDNATWTSTDATIATVSTTGLVTPIGAGTATITAEFEGATSTTIVTVSSPKMFLSDIGSNQVNVYDPYVDGPASVHIVGATTNLSAPWSLATYNDELYVTDISTNAIDVFPVTASGNVAPSRRITGATTTLSSPYGLAVYKDEIYVTSGARVLVFPTTATGNIAPTRIITGPTTGLTPNTYSLFVYKDQIYVTNYTGVLVFSSNGNGDIAPLRSIKGTHTQLTNCYGVYVANDEVYVTNLDGVRVYLTSSDGDATPIRNLTGSTTAISSATGVTLLGAELFVVNIGQTGTHVFSINATGNSAPIRTQTVVGTQNPRNVAFY